METPSIRTNFPPPSRHTLCNEDLCYWLRWMRAALRERPSTRQLDVCLGLAHGGYIGMGVGLSDRKAH